MKKSFKKFTKILVLIAMIFSDLMTPISVLANEITNRDPVKGDVGIDNKVTNNGNSATVNAGKFEIGNALITKNVIKKDAENGKYTVELKVKSKSKTSVHPLYVAVVFDTSGSMICDADRDGWSFISNGNNVHYRAGDGTNITCKSFNGMTEKGETLIKEKWESAIRGAINFSEKITALDNTYVSLIPFATKLKNVIPLSIQNWKLENLVIHMVVQI